MKLKPYDKNFYFGLNHYQNYYITKLLRNYRSHPNIIQISNELYYDNELIACNRIDSFIHDHFVEKFPIIFHGVNGIEEKEENSTRYKTINLIYRSIYLFIVIFHEQSLIAMEMIYLK